MNEADHTDMAHESWRWIAVILITFALHFAWEIAQDRRHSPHHRI